MFCVYSTEINCPILKDRSSTEVKQSFQADHSHCSHSRCEKKSALHVEAVCSVGQRAFSLHLPTLPVVHLWTSWLGNVSTVIWQNTAFHGVEYTAPQRNRKALRMCVKSTWMWLGGLCVRWGLGCKWKSKAQWGKFHWKGICVRREQWSKVTRRKWEWEKVEIQDVWKCNWAGGLMKHWTPPCALLHVDDATDVELRAGCWVYAKIILYYAFH